MNLHSSLLNNIYLYEILFLINKQEMNYFYKLSAETKFFLKLSNVPFIIFMKTRFLANQMQPIDFEYVLLTQKFTIYTIQSFHL